MKCFIYIIIFSVFLISILNLSAFIFIKNKPYFYANVDERLINKKIEDLDNFIGVKFVEDIQVKGILGYPYKIHSKSYGKGYSLTIYYDEEKKVYSISNKIFYMGWDTKFISKEAIISRDNYYERITIWPFIIFDLDYKLKKS